MRHSVSHLVEPHHGATPSIGVAQLLAQQVLTPCKRAPTFSQVSQPQASHTPLVTTGRGNFAANTRAVTPDVVAVARLYATWINKARNLHRLLTSIALHDPYPSFNEDGTVTVVVPAAEWLAAVDEARTALPADDF